MQTKQTAASNAAAEGVKHSEKTALAWGKLAAESIKAGDFKTAIERLNAGIMVTSYSQYTGTNFNK